MKLKDLRLLNIRLKRNDEIIFEGTTEDAQKEYGDMEVKILSTSNVMDMEILDDKNEVE